MTEEQPKENKITQTDIVNNKMLNSFDSYLNNHGVPVNIPPEPEHSEESAWDAEDVRFHFFFNVECTS